MSYLDLPPRVGNYASCVWPGPTLNAIDVMVRCSFTGTIAGGSGTIAHRWVGPNRSFFFTVNSSGTLSVTLSASGSDAFSAASTAALGFPFGGWVRFTWRDSDNALKFYTAPNVADPTGLWVQLGATTSLAMAGPIHTGGSGTAYPMLIGPTSGYLTYGLRVLRCILRDGYDSAGSTFYDIDFEKQAPGTVSFTEDALGATVTINQSANAPMAAITGRSAA